MKQYNVACLLYTSYGPITGKFVLYRGGSQVIDGIQYQNVEEYLRNLA